MWIANPRGWKGEGTLLGDTVAALRQNVELAFLRQELDLHAGSRLLPRLRDQMLLQARQTDFSAASAQSLAVLAPRNRRTSA